ncbi:hypothetical protein CHARACLAT_032038, partial [Characodon lateralis]|nr:hypothetical protein [Characodon lateralis]
MANCMVSRVRGVALAVLQPIGRQLSSRRRSSGVVPHRLWHGARSSLYEHVREGYSDRPELDMRAVCEETDNVIANVESRKGDLRGDDVRKIVRVWQELQAVRTEISELEEKKRRISETVKTLVNQRDKKALAN